MERDASVALCFVRNNLFSIVAWEVISTLVFDVFSFILVGYSCSLLYSLKNKEKQQ